MAKQAKNLVDISTLTLEGADSVAAVYSNNAELVIGPWDIRLVFTEIITGENIRKELRANIAMHPGHAKALAAALQMGVRQYEETYGAISMPKAVKPPTKEKTN